MMNLNDMLLRNGRIVDPGQNIDGNRDILIRGGKVIRIGEHLSPPERTEIADISGCLVFPGLIDMHVHLREPGQEEKETIGSGTRAAAHGGFTTVACMPNTQPVHDQPSVTRRILEKTAKDAVIRVLPVAAVTRGLRGNRLVRFRALQELGVVAFSNDGRVVDGERTFRRALNRIKEIDSLLIEHPEDHAISREGVVHEGYLSNKYGLKGIPSLSENRIVKRDLEIQAETGARLHLTHISTCEAPALIAAARKRSTRVSADVTPHHLLLTDELADPPTPCHKVKPPIRSEKDRQTLIRGLRDGIIDCIASDHAPHTREEKAREMNEAPFGICGVETLVPLIYDRLVRRGVISLSTMIQSLTLNPARILGLPEGGRIRLNEMADLTVIDPRKSFVIDESFFISKSVNSPFLGWRGRGSVVMTIAAGKVVFRETG